MTSETTIYRQGDVLIITTDMPAGPAADIPRENGKIVLAHGEVTGHSHTVDHPMATFRLVGGQHVLSSPFPMIVEHQEHAPITLPPGTFRVIIQREYSPGVIRKVLD